MTVVTDGLGDWRPGASLLGLARSQCIRVGEMVMSANRNQKWWQTMTLVGGALVVSGAATGCQVAVNGQTLPSPYYLEDDVQYFPGAGDFKLPREEAAQRAARAEEKLQSR